MEQNYGKKTTNLKNVEKVSTTVDEDASYGNGDGGKTLVLSCLIQDFPILYLIDFFWHIFNQDLVFSGSLHTYLIGLFFRKMQKRSVEFIKNRNDETCFSFNE